MSTLKELLQRREDLEQWMFCREMSDNFYYTSGRNAADRKQLFEINRQIAEAELGGKNV